MFGIAYRQFLRIRDGRTIQAVPLDEVPSEVPDDLFEQMQTTDLQIRVRKALESLPDIYRSVVFLVYIQGLTYSEAAQVLDVPIGTIKSRMNYAFNILRGRLCGEEALEHEMPQPDSLSK